MIYDLPILIHFYFLKKQIGYKNNEKYYKLHTQ